MGKFVNFCAGADQRILPADNVNGILLNVLDHAATSRKMDATRKFLRIAGSKYFMLDSSGYQLHVGEKKGKRLTSYSSRPMRYNSHEVNLAPKHVMESAAVLEPHIVVGLDFPIRKLKTAAEREAEFEKKLEYNIRWAFESAEWWKRLCPKSKFFLPIQCYNLNHLDVFFRGINGLCHHGISIPIRNLKLAEIALFMVSAHQRGERRVHLLGTSSFYVIALCAYMARHMFEWISLDASTWNVAAIHGGFSNPWDLSREDLSPRKVVSPNISNNCPCPYCGGRSYAQIQDKAKKEKRTLLRRHNWWAVERVFHELYENSDTLMQLRRYLLTRSRKSEKVEELINILSLADSLRDSDIEILQGLLSFKPKKRKPSHALRQLTVPCIPDANRPCLIANSQSESEQKRKSLTGGKSTCLMTERCL